MAVRKAQVRTSVVRTAHVWNSSKQSTADCRVVLPMPTSFGPFGPFGPFQNFSTFGWESQSRWSLEENLIALVSTIGLNCVKFGGFTGGHCGAVLCRPSEGHGVDEVEVIGLGINAPSRFEPTSWARCRMAEPRSPLRRYKRGNEIHAEMQILSRCARAGIPTTGSWMCIQMAPCWECCKALVAAGIARVIFECRPHQAEDKARAVKKWGRQMLAAEAAGMKWTAIPKDVQRKAYVSKLWTQFKLQRGLDREAVKALASDSTA
ncbi:unnamed protein product [Effrenium voratum]|nr:unnamed protein product [Effrenium voratum]